MGQLFRLLETKSASDGHSRLQTTSTGEYSPRFGSAKDSTLRNDLPWQASLKKYYRPGITYLTVLIFPNGDAN